MERIKELHDLARENLSPFHYSNIHYLYGNGYNGYPDAAPYHAIIVTAAPPSIPQSLIDQLAPGGQMVIPVGTDFQILYLVTKDADGLIHEIPVFSVVFVPMVK
jgi:protein-L-isoaspartate(D-aspartate) O-methyltransferase